MKTLFTSLFLAVLLTACDPNSDKSVGNRPNFSNANNGGGSAGAGGGTGSAANNNTPTDAPLDGGLSVLLIAGAAYGVKRARNKRSPKESNL